MKNYEPDGVHVVTNCFALTIMLAEEEESVYYRYQGGKKKEVKKAKVEYDDDGIPFFKTNYGATYYLDEFSKLM